MLTLNQIESVAMIVAKEFPITKIQLFGSYARGNYNADSDVDLLIEFVTDAVSLLTLSAVKLRFEELLGVPVDLVHAPIPEDSIIELDKVVSLYAA